MSWRAGRSAGTRFWRIGNLDWGQGLRSLARLEKQFRPLTIFYFGDVNPGHYLQPADGYLITATGTPVPLPEFAVETRYVAVSASLQHGPWGPAGYFRSLDALRPAAYTDDGTIAIYDLARRYASVEIPPLRQPILQVIRRLGDLPRRAPGHRPGRPDRPGGSG